MNPHRRLPHAILLTAAAIAAAAPGCASAARNAIPSPSPGLTVTITGQPSNPSWQSTASFTFTTSTTASTSCSLDGSNYHGCSSPVSYSKLLSGAHTFTVRATTKSSTATSSYSWTLALPTPGAPSNLAATGLNQQVFLTWSPATETGGSIVGYYVLRNGAKVGQTSGTSYGDTGLTNGTTYAYTVEAYDANGTVSLPSAPATATPAMPLPLGQSGGSWSLKFDDEFNASSLDLTKWQPNWFGSSNTTITPPDNRSDLNCLDPHQVTEGGGVLNLAVTARNCTASNGTTYPYAGGLINSHKSYTFTYGYLEARMYVPATSGGTPANFPAFWADGTGTWPASGELDVMEVLGTCGPGLGFHFHDSLGAFGGCAGSTIRSGWHTFGASWQSGVVTYYYDGQQVGQVTQGITSSPMYLLLNNSVDTAYGGPTLAPATVQIDYVRVWQ